jgi:hypothetical protein
MLSGKFAYFLKTNFRFGIAAKQLPFLFSCKIHGGFLSTQNRETIGFCRAVKSAFTKLARQCRWMFWDIAWAAKQTAAPSNSQNTKPLNYKEREAR